jgi:hypothetical protein
LRAALSCRVVDRRRRLARATTRKAGAPGVGAYPIDPEGHRVDSGFAYVGIASMSMRPGSNASL